MQDSSSDEEDGADPGSLFDQRRRSESPELPPTPPAQLDAMEGEDGPEFQDEETIAQATLEELRIAQEFIAALRNATLDNGDLPPEVVDRIRNPPTHKLDLDDDLAMRTGIELYLDTETASEEVFDRVRATFNRSMERQGIDYKPVPSLYHVKEYLAELTGIYCIETDMCPKSCIAYTGPYSNLDTCPKCRTPRYDPDILAATNGQSRVPQRQCKSIPIGPQIQALHRSDEGSIAMGYRRRETTRILEELSAHGNVITEWEDFCHGSQYLNAARGEHPSIKMKDFVLLMSLDGAQLYQSKESDCWIYIWVILDLPPDLRYKKRHIFPGGFIPGPNKPKNVDSFLFPGFHHVSALMKEGLAVWDAVEDEKFQSDPFMHLGTADGPGMQYLNGLTGHSGAYGCRTFCSCHGRRKGNHYYPALLKPLDYEVPGCDHPDIDPYHLSAGKPAEYNEALNTLVQSTNQTQYQKNRRSTGISKPSIFSGFPSTHTHAVPGCFGSDLMHLVSLNIPDLLLGLWRGTIECDRTDDKESWEWMVLTGDTWKTHGQQVVNATPYLPGSFDRTPRNPAEKISSGYKAWEYLNYIYGLGPGLFHGLLPNAHWKNFCKLVAGIRLLHQRKISKTQLIAGHRLLVGFVLEFENLYYRWRADRLHFCRQSLHALLHVGPEIIRLGPGVNYAQWVMERTIGNLGEEIRQHSNPFQNLAERGVRRARVNALLAMAPELETNLKKARRPQISQPLDNNYVLMGAREEYPHAIADVEAKAVRDYYREKGVQLDDNSPIRINKWARLQLPNQQLVRTKWKEGKKKLEELRISRNIMVFSDEFRR